VEILDTLLQAHWGIRARRLQALPSGHTNKTYLVHAGARRHILRVSWPGKSAAQVGREAAVLHHLHAVGGLPALPRALATLAGQACASTHDGRWLHLFEPIPGSPDLLGSRAAAGGLRALAGLHAALAALPATETSPVAWLRQRHRRVAAHPPPPLPAGLDADYENLLARIGGHLDHAQDWVAGPARWLHGDYHPGNLLHHGGELAGIIDFDETGQGSQWLEAAFALYAFSRDPAVETRLVHDRALWDSGLRAYAADGDAGAWLMRHRGALALLFCADQTLIHLEAAQRGLWTLGPGIGFLAAWRELLAEPAPGTCER